MSLERAADFMLSALRCAIGPSVSPLSTISAVSTTSGIATDMPRRVRDRPTARMAISSEVAASWPRPISEPMTAAVGNIVYARRGSVWRM